MLSKSFWTRVTINPALQNHESQPPLGRGLSKTLLENEKMQVYSTVSFTNNVLYPFRDNFLPRTRVNVLSDDTFNPLPDMPILGPSKSATKKVWCQKYGQMWIQLSD